MTTMTMMTKNYTYDSDNKLLAVESYFPKYKVKFDRSKGEKMISRWLKKHKIHFKSEFTFPNLKAIKKLRYDFAILDDNNNVLALIEFQGDQHFHPVPRWGGLHGHLSTAKHDQIKALYARRNNIPLFYITESEQKKIYPMLEQLINYLFPQQIN